MASRSESGRAGGPSPDAGKFGFLETQVGEGVYELGDGLIYPGRLRTPLQRPLLHCIALVGDVQGIVSSAGVIEVSRGDIDVELSGGIKAEGELPQKHQLILSSNTDRLLYEVREIDRSQDTPDTPQKPAPEPGRLRVISHELLQGRKVKVETENFSGAELVDIVTNSANVELTLWGNRGALKQVLVKSIEGDISLTVEGSDPPTDIFLGTVSGNTNVIINNRKTTVGIQKTSEIDPAELGGLSIPSGHVPEPVISGVPPENPTSLVRIVQFGGKATVKYPQHGSKEHMG